MTCLSRPALMLPVLCAALAVAGCETQKSRNPLSPAVAGPIPGVEITSPKPVEPANGAKIETTQQPVRLKFENAATNGERPLWMELEVATDANFTSRIHSVPRVDPGSNGQTSYPLPMQLEGGRTYYWRVRGLDGANTGPFSSANFFEMVVPVVIDTPVPLSPIRREVTTSLTPTLTVQNGNVAGQAGTVSYQFEVATDVAFAGMVAGVAATRAGGGTTSAVVPVTLTANKEYYWRVRGTNGQVTSAWSPTQAFKTPAAPTSPGPGPTPTPPPQTPGTVGPPRTISIQEAHDIIKNYHDRTGAYLGSGSTRDQRWQWFFGAVAIIHYGHPVWNPKGPDSGWCVKDAGGGRPPSDDVIVRCSTRDAFDLILSAGADGYQFHIDGIGILPGDQNVYPPPRSYLPN